MNDVERIIKAQRYQTSHVLHLLVGTVLCLLFLPIGLAYLFVFWPMISLSNAIELKALETGGSTAVSAIIKLVIAGGVLWVILEGMGW